MKNFNVIEPKRFVNNGYDLAHLINTINFHEEHGDLKFEKVNVLTVSETEDLNNPLMVHVLIKMDLILRKVGTKTKESGKGTFHIFRAKDYSVINLDYIKIGVK